MSGNNRRESRGPTALWQGHRGSAPEFPRRGVVASVGWGPYRSPAPSGHCGADRPAFRPVGQLAPPALGRVLAKKGRKAPPATPRGRGGQAAAWGAREAVPQWGIRRSRKRPERVMRNKRCEAPQASIAPIEHADTRVLRSGAGRRIVPAEKRRAKAKGSEGSGAPVGHSPQAKATWSPVVRGARGGNSARGARAIPYETSRAKRSKRAMRRLSTRDKEGHTAPAPARTPGERASGTGACRASARTGRDGSGATSGGQTDKQESGPEHSGGAGDQAGRQAQPAPPTKEAGRRAKTAGGSGRVGWAATNRNTQEAGRRPPLQPTNNTDLLIRGLASPGRSRWVGTNSCAAHLSPTSCRSLNRAALPCRGIRERLTRPIAKGEPTTTASGRSLVGGEVS